MGPGIGELHVAGGRAVNDHAHLGPLAHEPVERQEAQEFERRAIRRPAAKLVWLAQSPFQGPAINGCRGRPRSRARSGKEDHSVGLGTITDRIAGRDHPIGPEGLKLGPGPFEGVNVRRARRKSGRVSRSEGSPRLRLIIPQAGHLCSVGRPPPKSLTIIQTPPSPPRPPVRPSVARGGLDGRRSGRRAGRPAPGREDRRWSSRRGWRPDLSGGPDAGPVSRTNRAEPRTV